MASTTSNLKTDLARMFVHLGDDRRFGRSLCFHKLGHAWQHDEALAALSDELLDHLYDCLGANRAAMWRALCDRCDSIPGLAGLVEISRRALDLYYPV